MPRDSLRYLIVVGLLALALGLAGLLVWLPATRGGPASDSELIFVADIDNWRQTDLRRLVYSPYDFSLGPNLGRLPLQLGEWQGEDIPQTNLEVFILLEPEEYVYRRYQDPDGRILWLSLIGSRKSKSFHPPQICYSTDGWRTAVSTSALQLGEGEVHALRLDATKDGSRHLVLYFYLWPDVRRDPAAGAVLFKVTVPVLGAVESTDEAVALAEQFVAGVFTQGRAF